MWIGILAGVSTGALWGVTFIAAAAVAPFTAIDIAIGRYIVFGIASLAVLFVTRRSAAMTPRQRRIGLLLGAFGYSSYFLALSLSVAYAGASIPPLVIGLMPVAVALIANWRDHSVPWRPLIPALVLIFAGLVAVNVGVFTQPVAGTPGEVAIGLALSFLCLVIWVVFALINGAIMSAPDAPPTAAWSAIQGLGAMVGGLALIPFGAATSGFAHYPLDAPETLNFLGWALLMGLVGSWFAGWCWMEASKRLPVALTGQLIVSETLFGLAFGFAYAGRWPITAEWVGAALQFAGVVAAIRLFTMRRRVAA